MAPSNSAEYMLEYSHKHKTKKTLADNAKRKRDRYQYEKKNGKIPRSKELDHNWGLTTWKIQVIAKITNRSKWAKVAIWKRKTRAKNWWKY